MTTVSSTQEDRDPVMVELGENFTRLQAERGLSLKQLERAVVRLLKDEESPTHETIRQYHAGAGKASRANLALIAALCVVYNVAITDVSPELGRRAEQLRLVLTTAIDPSEHILWYVHETGKHLRSRHGAGDAGQGDQAWTQNFSTGTPAINGHEASPTTRYAPTGAPTAASRNTSPVAA